VLYVTDSNIIRFITTAGEDLNALQHSNDFLNIWRFYYRLCFQHCGIKNCCGLCWWYWHAGHFLQPQGIGHRGWQLFVCGWNWQ
jgi:hypothetical protein